MARKVYTLQFKQEAVGVQTDPNGPFPGRAIR